MKKVLILCSLLITVITAFAAVSFAQRPMNYDRTMNSDPTYNQTMAAMNDLVRSINALGGSIKVEDGKVSIKLSFTENQERMLEEAIANKDSMRYERAMANGDMGDMNMGYINKGAANMGGGNMGGTNAGCEMPNMPPMTGSEYCTERADYCNHFLHSGIPRNESGCNGMAPDMPMQGMAGMMGAGQMMPMNMQVNGMCPKCGTEMEFIIKCNMMDMMGRVNTEERTMAKNKPCPAK